MKFNCMVKVNAFNPKFNHNTGITYINCYHSQNLKVNLLFFRHADNKFIKVSSPSDHLNVLILIPKYLSDFVLCDLNYNRFFGVVKVCSIYIHPNIRFSFYHNADYCLSHLVPLKT